MSRRLNGWCAAIVAALLIAGCTQDNQGDADTANTEEPRQINVVEPIGQRSPYGNYLAGRFAERQKDFARAAAALGRALDDSPDNVGLMRRTFFLSLEAGDSDMALRMAHKLEESGVKISTAQLLLAAESVSKEDFAGALQRLELIDREDLARYSVPLALAWAHAGANETADAVAALAPLDQESGFATLRQLHEAFLHDFAGRASPAEAAYRASL
ncbi:MAG: hypothetical protein IMF05_00700, partial [Proteobacteria bacterium]|nr:hypothetical protein [Pseudomonadota bacterium]